MKRLFTILFVLLCFVSHSNADVMDDAMIENVTSPQVSNMFRYGDVPTSLFTGRIDLSIPLYTLDDPDFPLQISLTYNSEGFKPTMSSGFVGYGWFLNAGGCITREVRGVPDECIFQWTNGIIQYGMLATIRYGWTGAYKEDIFNFSNSCMNKTSVDGYYIGQESGTAFDYQPDIFHFNFCGHSGSFMIDNDGNPFIINGDFVEIDLSHLVNDEQTQNKNINYPHPNSSAKIIITTLDGYQYIFGGSLSAIEYSVGIRAAQKQTGGNNMCTSSFVTANAWFLTQIIAPNRRTMNFSYKNTGYTDYDNNIWRFTEHYVGPPTTLPGYSFDKNIAPPSFAGYTLSKECILEYITIPSPYNLRIDFRSSVALHKLYPDNRCNMCKPNYQLDAILVTKNNLPFRRANLRYAYQYREEDVDNKYYWRFLSGVTLSDIGSYQLEYNHGSTEYPSLNVPNDQYYITFANEYGYAKEVSSTRGLLRSITYPTGGKQVFVFDEHDYGTRRYYSVTGMTNLQLINDGTGAHYYQPRGARISSIETYDNNTLIEKRNFTYQTKDHKSSGIYYDRLRIFYKDDVNLIPTEYGVYSTLQTHVGYSRVVETTYQYPSQDRYTTEYEFSTGDNQYSTSSDPYINIRQIMTANDTVWDIYFTNLLTYNSVLSPYGKLLSKVCKDKNGHTVTAYMYQYNNIPSSSVILMPQGRFHYGRSKEIVIFGSTVSFGVSRKLQIYPAVLEQEVCTSYTTDGNSLFTNRCYEYDSKRRIITQTSDNSDGKVYFQSYRYPDWGFSDVWSEGSYAEGWRLLADKKRISNPIETISGYFDESNRKFVTAARLSLYRKKSIINAQSTFVNEGETATTPSMPDKPNLDLYSWIRKDMQLKLDAPISNFAPLSVRLNEVAYDSRYQTTCDYLYNTDWIRPTTISPVGQPATTYQWQGLYPVSKTIGSQTYTYTYIPYVGISSITDPRGITTYYNYDDAGRLTEVYQISDGKKQVMQTYYYHYSTQQ